MTHICVGNLTIVGSDNALVPVRRQAIIWTNAGIVLIGPLGTNLIEMLIEIHTFSSKKIHLKVSSVKWRPFCLGLNALSVHDTHLWTFVLFLIYTRLYLSDYLHNVPSIVSIIQVQITDRYLMLQLLKYPPYYKFRQYPWHSTQE